MSSIAGVYFEYGSKGLTEEGRKKGLEHVGFATLGILLIITGIALLILCELYSTGTIPSNFCIFRPECVFGRYTVGLLIGLVLGFIPIVGAIGGGALMEVHRSFLFEDLTDQDKALFLEPPTASEFKDHQNL